MQNRLIGLYVKSQVLWNTIKEDHGQDLVEYAAVISLVVLGITAGMTTLADGINTVIASVTTKMSTKLC